MNIDEGVKYACQDIKRGGSYGQDKECQSPYTSSGYLSSCLEANARVSTCDDCCLPYHFILKLVIIWLSSYPFSTKEWRDHLNGF